MKKKLNISELGSLMIEAMAMLALIAFITPILHRKTAERTTELQDINSAGELRAIVKAVDDYVSANYDAIVDGENISKGGCGDYNFSNFKDKTNHAETIPIKHFCEFLPYGILDSNGNAKKSRLFSENYKIVLKMNGNAEGDKVITAFVVTEPNSDLSQLRASSIASMIGGNGGFVTDNTGDGKISGNLGIWGIDDVKSDLGLQNLKKNAIVAASIEGISSQNAKIDVEGVLYRVKKTDLDLNTMSTTLYMGSGGGSEPHNDIVNIKRLIVGALEASGGNDRLYINSGDIRIGAGGGNISVDGSGSLTLANGDITTNVGNIYANSGNITVSGTMSAAATAFTVASDGATKALRYQTNDNNIILNGTVSNRSGTSSLINQPLQVGTCSNVGTNQLCVKGNTRIEGDLIVTETFSAKNLNAREKLTVGNGGDTQGDAALSVEYASNASKFNFAQNLLTATQTSAGGELKFSDFVKATKTSSDRQFLVGYDGTYATHVQMATGANQKFVMNTISGQWQINNSDLQLNPGGADGVMTLFGSQYITLNGKMFQVNNNTDTISSIVNSFKISPVPVSQQAAGTEYFDVTNSHSGTKGVVVNEMNTYMEGSNANQYMRGGTFHLQPSGAVNTDSDIVRISNTVSANTQIDITSPQVTMKKTGSVNEADKILKIDLSNLETTVSDNYPVYIRRGAVELTHNVVAGDTYKPSVTSDNYVKADRFVANKTLDSNGLPSGSYTSARFEVNPAYTSVMHDIKLTTRGGARLSDILPDFINKGIYVVDNTYPAKGYNNTSHCGANGESIQGYMGKGRSAKQSVQSCSYYEDHASPWVGFVPAPTCPPGYAKVVSIGLHGISMAQAGVPQPTLGQHVDLIPSYDVKGPYNVGETDPAPTPLYYQKNTWLKSTVAPYQEGGIAVGWDVIIGFVYPYTQYKNYFTSEKYGSGVSYTSFDYDGTSDSDRVIWNMFPVYVGTLEGTATVYCYFNRAGTTFQSNPLIDKTYDQLNNFRDPNSKTGAEAYTDRLNEDNSGLGVW